MTVDKPLISDQEEMEILRRIASDPDAPELTEDQLRQGKPFHQQFPALSASIAREKAKRGRPPVDKPRQQVSVRLDADVIDFYKATGKGWQTRMNADLRKSAGLVIDKP